MNSRGWYWCDEENEYHIEWFELGLQTSLHSVIEVYNMNEQKKLAEMISETRSYLMKTLVNKTENFRRLRGKRT